MGSGVRFRRRLTGAMILVVIVITLLFASNAAKGPRHARKGDEGSHAGDVPRHAHHQETQPEKAGPPVGADKEVRDRGDVDRPVDFMIVGPRELLAGQKFDLLVIALRRDGRIARSARGAVILTVDSSRAPFADVEELDPQDGGVVVFEDIVLPTPGKHTITVASVVEGRRIEKSVQWFVSSDKSRGPFPKRFGDLDGDGDVDFEDAGLLEGFLSRRNRLSELQRFAADLNKDRLINGEDLELLVRLQSSLMPEDHDPPTIQFISPAGGLRHPKGFELPVQVSFNDVNSGVDTSSLLVFSNRVVRFGSVTNSANFLDKGFLKIEQDSAARGTIPAGALHLGSHVFTAAVADRAGNIGIAQAEFTVEGVDILEARQSARGQATVAVAEVNTEAPPLEILWRVTEGRATLINPRERILELVPEEFVGVDVGGIFLEVIACHTADQQLAQILNGAAVRQALETAGLTLRDVITGTQAGLDPALVELIRRGLICSTDVAFLALSQDVTKPHSPGVSVPTPKPGEKATFSATVINPDPNRFTVSSLQFVFQVAERPEGVEITDVVPEKTTPSADDLKMQRFVIKATIPFPKEGFYTLKFDYVIKFADKTTGGDVTLFLERQWVLPVGRDEDANGNPDIFDAKMKANFDAKKAAEQETGNEELKKADEDLASIGGKPLFVVSRRLDTAEGFDAASRVRENKDPKTGKFMPQIEMGGVGFLDEEKKVATMLHEIRHASLMKRINDAIDAGELDEVDPDGDGIPSDQDKNPKEAKSGDGEEDANGFAAKFKDKVKAHLPKK